jgi:glycerol-3-phosphate dehydrogenase (NAD(P)+)
MTMVAEGVKTAKSAYDLSLREEVEMPITTEVYRALYEGKPPEQAVASLLRRALRPERD